MIWTPTKKTLNLQEEFIETAISWGGLRRSYREVPRSPSLWASHGWVPLQPFGSRQRHLRLLLVRSLAKELGRCLWENRGAGS